MKGRYPRLCADDEGIWRESESGHRFGLAWNEIEWVRCFFWQGLHGATEVSVALHAKNGGIGLELGGSANREADAPGLNDVVAAMAIRLGLPDRWYADLHHTSPGQQPVMVWARTGPPRVHADDRGLWCQEFDQFTAWARVAGVIARKGRDGALIVALDVAVARDDDLSDMTGAVPGFAECVRAMAARLPGMPAAWLEAAHDALAPGEAMAVWRRSYPQGYPRLYADDLGVCREDQPDNPVDLAWDTVERVLGREQDGHTEIELESTDGTRLLLRSDWEGYAEVVDAMAAMLPHMSAERLAKIALLKPGHALWRRGWTIAGEALEPDGTLATTWQRSEG